MEEEPVHKPRQSRGTPAYKFSYKASAYFVGGCVCLHFILMHFNKDRFYRKIAVGYYDESKFSRKKRALMSNALSSPNPLNQPVREFEELTSTLEYGADNTLDIDLK